jgi:hypothetical protein
MDDKNAVASGLLLNDLLFFCAVVAAVWCGSAFTGHAADGGESAEDRAEIEVFYDDSARNGRTSE